ncbi:MAG TPA: CBS domain-containing protein [Candidatus Limnocylindrales bacterium]|nr:CBS domain-containing protein [Candidatus Limnocylindrales bacterium]
MSGTELETTATKLRQEQIDRYWAGDLTRKSYLYRRQRKAILEHCRRIAVVGASADPNSPIFISTEKLLGMGLEIIPVFPGRESLLGLRCYAKLSDIPGKLDIVQVYPGDGVDYQQLAREAVAKNVNTFWMEPGLAASREVEEILVNGKVHLVEYENLETEYLKHLPFTTVTATPRKDRKATKVRERMSKNPAKVKPDDGLKDAIWKMDHGHFRHLPVVDEHEKLIGMITDRDIRSIRPSLAFVGKEDATVQLWSISVQQAAVFDPISVKPETSLKEAGELMLRWHVGGLPVVDDHEKVVGMITYTDLLREFVGREENH